MPRGYKTFGQLKVAKAPGADPKVRGNEPLILTFIDMDVMSATADRLKREGYEIIDHSPGYRLFRGVDEAVEAVAVFCERAS